MQTNFQIKNKTTILNWHSMAFLLSCVWNTTVKNSKIWVTIPFLYLFAKCWQISTGVDQVFTQMEGQEIETVLTAKVLFSSLNSWGKGKTQLPASQY